MGELSKYYEDTFKEYSLEKPENSHLYDEFFVSLMKEYRSRIQSLGMF